MERLLGQVTVPQVQGIKVKGGLFFFTFFLQFLLPTSSVIILKITTILDTTVYMVCVAGQLGKRFTYNT